MFVLCVYLLSCSWKLISLPSRSRRGDLWLLFSLTCNRRHVDRIGCKRMFICVRSRRRLLEKPNSRREYDAEMEIAGAQLEAALPSDRNTNDNNYILYLKLVCMMSVCLSVC